MKISYSEDADVLYLTFSDQRSGAAYIEKDNGDILRVDAKTGKILGVTIQLFLYRLKQGETIELPELGLGPFNHAMTHLLESRLVKTH